MHAAACSLMPVADVLVQPNAAVNCSCAHAPLPRVFCCCVQGAGGLWPDTYKLVMQYPRRVLEPADAATTTLQAAGFEAHSQQAVFVEHME